MAQKTVWATQNTECLRCIHGDGYHFLISLFHRCFLFLQCLTHLVLWTVKHIHIGPKGMKKRHGAQLEDRYSKRVKAIKAEGAVHWRGWAMWKWWRASTSSSYAAVILSLSPRKGSILKWQVATGSTSQWWLPVTCPSWLRSVHHTGHYRVSLVA